MNRGSPAILFLTLFFTFFFSGLHSAEKNVKMVIHPAKAIYGTPFSLKVIGLQPGEVVHLKACSTDKTGINWVSSADFKADKNGLFDPAIQAPILGDYLEKDTLGLYLTGHPIDQFLDELRQFTTHRIKELNPDKKQNIVIAGLIIAMRTMITKTGKKMAFITIDDRSGRQEVALFAEKYETFKDILVKDTVIVITGELGMDHYSGNARVNVKTF